MSYRSSIFFLFTVLILFTSCSSSVRISSINCPDRMRLFSFDRSANNVKSFSVKKMGIGHQNISLYDLFLDEKINCANVKEVSFDIVQRPFDVILSVLPNFSARTIIIYYR